jgi:putative phage-type endonuclease
MERNNMLTEQQKLLRADKLGSSDAPAVMGCDKYRNASDVFMVKTGIADDFEGNEATARGNLLEPVLIRYAEQQLGWAAQPDLCFVHPSNLLIANLDAGNGISAPTEIIEAKSTVLGEEWGENGTDEIPDRVNVQIAHQFACVPSARVAWVPVLLPGFRSFDWRLYRVERNEDLVSIVEAGGLAFMREHVVPRHPPSDFRPSLEVLRRVRRQPNKTVQVNQELIDLLAMAREAKSKAEKAEKEAQAAVLAALGDADGGEAESLRVTYMLTKRKGYTVEPTEYRQLRIAKK